MSSITSYKTTAFKESQKFLVIDPSTQSPSLVLGSDLVSYISPMLNYVRADSTRLSAENTDYDVGTLVQTSGATSPGDNFAATYLVVEGGTGDFPMLNGNDLLVIKGDEFLREQLIQNTAGDGSDLVAHTGTSDTVTEALDKRTIYVGSVQGLVDLTDPIDGAHYEVTGYHPGSAAMIRPNGGGVFYYDSSRSKAEHNGGNIIDPDKTFPADWTVSGDVTAWFSAASSGTGVYVKITDKLSPDDFGAFGDGVKNDQQAMTAVQNAIKNSSIELLTLNRKRTYLYNESIILGSSFGFRGISSDVNSRATDAPTLLFDGLADEYAIKTNATGDISQSGVPDGLLNGFRIRFSVSEKCNGFESTRFRQANISYVSISGHKRGVNFLQTWSTRVYDLEVINGVEGINLDNTVNAVTFFGCKVGINSAWGLRSAGTNRDVKWVGGSIEVNGIGFLNSAPSRNIAISTYWEGNTTDIEITAACRPLVVDKSYFAPVNRTETLLNINTTDLATVSIKDIHLDGDLVGADPKFLRVTSGNSVRLELDNISLITDALGIGSFTNSDLFSLRQIKYGYTLSTSKGWRKLAYEATPASGWTSTNGLRFYRSEEGSVRMVGNVDSGSIPINFVTGLPECFHPAESTVFNVPIDTGSGFVNNGFIRVLGGEVRALDGSAGTWFIDVAYEPMY